MNANELANGIENCTTDPLHKQAATMLRQQQAEIEALKAALSIKVILNEHAQQSMKEIKELFK
jgi:hypothetical protein